MSNGTDRSGMLRIDMSKPQQISAGAASYVERSEEELELMAKKAEKCLRDLEELAKEDESLKQEGGTLPDLGPLAEETASLLGLTPAGFSELSFQDVCARVRHVLRMSRKAKEIVKIRREKLYTQTLTRVVWPVNRGPRTQLEGLFGGKK